MEYAVLFVLLCVGTVASWNEIGAALHRHLALGSAQVAAAMEQSLSRGRHAGTEGQGGGLSRSGPGGGTPPGTGRRAPPASAGPGGPGAKVKPGPSAGGAPAGPASAPTGLGPAVDAIVAQSPTLAADVQALQRAGWTIRYAKPGEKANITRRGKSPEIVLKRTGKPVQITRTLAHEVGHAGHALPPAIPAKGLTREQYTQKNLNRHLESEGAATLSNGRIRAEILKNGGPDIGFSGKNSTKFEQIYNNHAAGKLTEAQARAEIGKVYGSGERTGHTKVPYNVYYSKAYAEAWDRVYSGKPKGFVAP